MSDAARVQRGKGPAATMTEATYRKKALPYLLTDFRSQCAYCLDPGEFRHPSQTQVDHFDCKLPPRKRHQYVNLMLACAACNRVKHDNPIRNPFDPEQRLLNCTEENEFPNHIAEADDGQWVPLTKPAVYHLEVIGLTEESNRKKRLARREVALEIQKICSMAVTYKASNPKALHDQLMDSVKIMLGLADNFPPLLTDAGVVSTRDWLKSQGIDVSNIVLRVSRWCPLSNALDSKDKSIRQLILS